MLEMKKKENVIIYTSLYFFNLLIATPFFNCNSIMNIFCFSEK